MGKVVKFTGSKLLGAELRRLRGGRSLKQISELSKSPPLSERVAPVAAPTLSQIENGISFPSLETVHSLSHIYKRPVQQLLDLVVQERLLAVLDLPPSLGEATTRFRTALGSGTFGEALAIAVWAEQNAEGDQQLRWRANRAVALSKIGMLHDAIDLLEECVDDAALPEAQRYQLHQSLADMLARAGLLRSAVLHADEAERLAPADLSDRRRRPILRGRAFLLITRNEQREQPEEREARQALQLLKEAARLTPGSDTSQQRLIAIHSAWATAHAGHPIVACKELQELVADARADGHEDRVLRESLQALGYVHARRGSGLKAIAPLEETASLAADAGDAAMAFDAFMKLYGLVQASKPELASHYLRRCERFYPFVAGRTPSVREFERLTRSN